MKYALLDTARPAVDADGDLTWSIFQQGAGRVSVAEAVLNPPPGEANMGMIPGQPYVGPTVYRDGEFILVDEDGEPLADLAARLLRQKQGKQQDSDS